MNYKTPFLSCISALLVIGLFPDSLLAQAQSSNPQTQTPATDDSTITLSEFVVHGISSGLSNATEIKKNAAVTVDAISAEGIGSFPDTNIAESLQRIPGVQIQRDRGEGTEVSIDGLDPKFDLVTFNGRVLTSGTGGRDLDFRLFDPTFVENLEVFKTPSADLIEGALSGTVNAQTLRPVDLGVRNVVVNAGYQVDANSGKWGPDMSFIYSDVFDGGKLGVSFGASYTVKNIETDWFQGYGMDPYAHPTVGATPGYLVPNANYYNVDVQTHTRSNFVASVQYKPSKDFDTYIDLLYAKYRSNDLQYNDALRYDNGAQPTGWDGPVTSETTTVVAGQNYGLNLDQQGIDYRNNARDYLDEYYTDSLGWGFKWKASDLITLVGDASYSYSQHLQSNLGLETIGAANATYSAPLGTIPVTTFDAGYNPLNPNGFYALSYNGYYKEPTTDKNEDAKLDATVKLHWSFLDSLQLGVRASDRQFQQDSNSVDVPATTLATLLGVPLANTLNAGQVASVGSAISAAPFVGIVTPNTSFFSGKIPTPFLAFQPALLYSKVSPAALLAAAPITQVLANDFGVKEQTLAEYLRLNFAGNIGGMPLSGNIGVRPVTTWQTSSGYAPNLSQIVFSQAGATTFIPNVTPESVSRSYTDFLPSFNAKLDLTNKLALRLGLARVMSRPDLNLLGTGTSVNANVSSISSENPLLNPYQANQINLSLEYYLPNGGLLSVEGFYKKVQSFISTATTTEPLTVQLQAGGTEVVNFAHSFPANGQGASLQGLELAYKQQFKSLPKPFDGFGVEANYTYEDVYSPTAAAGYSPVVLTGVSKNNYNLVLYYENKLFSARLAYDYRSGYVTDPSSYFGDGIYTESLGVLDASARIRLTKNLALVLNANNLTNAYLIQKNLYNVLRTVEDNGVSYEVSVRAQF